MISLRTPRWTLVTLAISACAPPEESAPRPPEDASYAPGEVGPWGEEPVAESRAPSLGGWLCGGLCATAGGVACALVTDTCATATVVTVGSTAIPCAVAVVGSCLGALACLSLCAYDSPGVH